VGHQKLLAGVANELVELGSTVAIGALLQLRVDVHRHLRVGVPDLAHDPLHVEVVGQQSDQALRQTRSGSLNPAQDHQPEIEQPHEAQHDQLGREHDHVLGFEIE
jgi:hypothetical protein